LLDPPAARLNAGAELPDIIAASLPDIRLRPVLSGALLDAGGAPPGRRRRPLRYLQRT
jgi:hypothetical protein